MSCLRQNLGRSKAGLRIGAGNAQYPPFDLSHGALRLGQDRLQKRRQAAIVIGPTKPSSNTVGVMLVAAAVLRCEAAAP
jgi:hypothetical protein